MDVDGAYKNWSLLLNLTQVDPAVLMNLSRFVDAWSSYHDIEHLTWPRFTFLLFYLGCLLSILQWEKKLLRDHLVIKLLLMITLNTSYFGLIQLPEHLKLSIKASAISKSCYQ